MDSEKKNPLEDYLLEKKAFGPPASGGGFRGQFGRAMVAAGGAAAASSAVAGVGMAASKLYDAATKTRDFRRMLESNPDLADKHQENPKLFNQMFTTLRTFNPEFSRDPLVAGTYLRQMSEDPMHAGGKVVDALNYRGRMQQENPILRSAMGAGAEHFKPKRGPQEEERYEESSPFGHDMREGPQGPRLGAP